jgi:hypothetical protein
MNENETQQPSIKEWMKMKHNNQVSKNEWKWNTIIVNASWMEETNY